MVYDIHRAFIIESSVPYPVPGSQAKNLRTAGLELRRASRGIMKRGKEFVSLGHVLPGILKSIRHDGDEQLVLIWERWDRIVGESIAKNARPAAFKGKLLLVEVSSSVWIHQLQFLKEEIIDTINAAFGKEVVNEIKFKVGTAEP